MDDYGIQRRGRGIRARALERIVKLSSTTTIDRLLSVLASPESFHYSTDPTVPPQGPPVSFNELEVLLSLARAAGSISDPDQAESVLRVLGLYLRSTLVQPFASFAAIKDVEPSPWQVCARRLVAAILTLGTAFPAQLAASAETTVLRYFDCAICRWKDPATFTDLDTFFPLLFSFQGFLEAMAQHVFALPYSVLTKTVSETIETISTDLLLQIETTVARTAVNTNPPEPEPLARWQYYIFAYLRRQQQLGAMLLNYYICNLCRAVTSKIIIYQHKNVVTSFRLKNTASSLLNKLLGAGKQERLSPDSVTLLDTLAQFAISQIHSLDEGADYIELASPERIELAYSTKASALDIVGVAANYSVVDPVFVVSLIKSSLLHEHGMSHPRFALTVFKLAALLCTANSEIAGVMVRYLPHFITIPVVAPDLVRKCARALVCGLCAISQDVVVSTIYTLVNMVTVTPGAQNVQNAQNAQNAHPDSDQQDAGDEQYALHVHRNAISAIVSITTTYDDPQVSALAATVLAQKLGSSSLELDREVAYGVSKLAAYVPDKEFLSILRSFQTLALRSFQTGDKQLRNNVQVALCRLCTSLSPEHPLYDVCLSELLKSIVNRGDVQQLAHHRPHNEISATAKEIAFFLPPLARLLPSAPDKPYTTADPNINSLFRNTWYNMVVHGYAQNSEYTQNHRVELEIIARSTPPLVSAESSNKIESDLELNTVLQRGSSHRNVDNQREIMESIAAANHFDLKTIQYPKLMFLAASMLLESLRANTGDCSQVLLYFGDPGVRAGDTKRYMRNISLSVLKSYLKNVVRGNSSMFTNDQAALQLKETLRLCCHRVKAIQEQAFENCDIFVQNVPSALCSETSMFALLDLLTLVWQSCMDAETHEYEPRALFSAPKSKICIQLSDSYAFRRETLLKFHTKAKAWVCAVLSYAPYDTKNILTSYMTDMENYSPIDSVALGFTFALEMGGVVTSKDRELLVLDRSSSNSLSTDTSAGFLSQYIWRREFHTAVQSDIISKVTPNFYDQAAARIKKALVALAARLKDAHRHVCSKPSFKEVQSLLFKASGSIGHPTEGMAIARLCVDIPMYFFTEPAIQFGISLWTWAMNEQPDLKALILAQVALMWEWSVKERLGLFNRTHDLCSPAFSKMEYAPTNKPEINHDANVAQRDFSCHQKLVRFLSSAFQAIVFESRYYLKIFSRLLLVGLKGLSYASLHPLARTARFELVKFALEVLDVQSRLGVRTTAGFKHLIITAALTWFAQPAQWPFGGNKLNLKADMELLTGIAVVFKAMAPNNDQSLKMKRNLLLVFMANELTKMQAWCDPLQLGAQFKDGAGKGLGVEHAGLGHVTDAWSFDPALAVYLVERFKQPDLVARLCDLCVAQPYKVVEIPEALQYFVSAMSKSKLLHYLVYWNPVSPIESINLFLPQYHGNSLLLQYAMRSLESHDVNVTFFYVPQLVQTLRFDSYGYVERFILETANISQLFAHQIIWNVLANLFTGDDVPAGTPEDPINPTLQRVIDRMTANLSVADREFYEREFGFFNTVTSISKSLMPLLRKTKAEKKAKIDEEIAKIQVDVGVYLPSNPDGIVVDIDRKAGKPLQSHAKTPFMATFKIERKVRDISDEDNVQDEEELPMRTVQVWQSAIFKVGDDCRQDVMALQLISIFRSIFNASGLDLYVFPYRVTATAPGCGVIDVLPKSISRDMLGREAVNGLYEYFTSKFGGEDSIQFQQARNNFVKSLAAYSVISYLIQFKDRHNGNIMYDDQGHVLHIDFGFCFDIVPGGVKFEAAPFKLTHEMVLVMGGSTTTQAYRWFEELAVKAYLACRPHAETIIQAVVPMLDSGLPCFKGDVTIKKLRARFVLDKSEREAALYMRSLIRQSYESFYTKGYDEFQRLTNGIPY